MAAQGTGRSVCVEPPMVGRYTPVMGTDSWPGPTPDVARKLKHAVAMLREMTNPKRIILFGSHARGEADAGSDVDLMVVTPHVEDRLAETVRLSRALRPLRMPLDLVVVSESTFRDRSGAPGTVYFEAATEGRVVYEAA